MIPANKSALSTANAQGRDSSNQTCTTNSAQSRSAHKLKLGTKQFRVVDRLIVGPLHRFEAERYPVSDHCLPSTISELQKRYKLSFDVEMIRLPGYGGQGARVAQYTLTKNSLGKAMVLVGLA